MRLRRLDLRLRDMLAALVLSSAGLMLSNGEHGSNSVPVQGQGGKARTGQDAAEN